MTGARYSRRLFLTAAATAGAGIASIGQASAAATDRLDNACSRDGDQENSTGPIDVPPTPGESDKPDKPAAPAEAIDATVVESGTPGPTAVIVGGIHGDEKAGIIAAHHITEWDPNTGRLVILPEVNPPAIEGHTRTNNHGDLNRKFDYGEAPATELAQVIWRTVNTARPDLLIALHESRGIYEGSPSGVGQAIFRSPGEDTDDAATMGIRRVNRTIGSQELKFNIGHITGPETAPTGLLVEKAAYEASIPSFIVETYENVHLKARVRWQELCVKGVLDYYDLY